MDVPEPLRKALDKVKAAEGHPEGGELARRLRPLLEAAVAEITSSGVTRPSRRGTGAMSYVVETTQQGEVLTERRHGGRSKPYRCPKGVYDALAAVLGIAERPLAMDEIMSAVEARWGDRPADHQVRVALRLWLHVDPPIISRNRARHRSIDPTSVVQEVKHLWDRLGRASI